MKILLMIGGFSVVTMLGVTVFVLEGKVRSLMQEETEIGRQIEAEMENIRVLKAEWAYLSQPSRIQKLASEHLSLKNADESQVITLSGLDARYAEEAPVPNDKPELLAENDADSGDDLVNNVELANMRDASVVAWQQ